MFWSAPPGPGVARGSASAARSRSSGATAAKPARRSYAAASPVGDGEGPAQALPRLSASGPRQGPLCRLPASLRARSRTPSVQTSISTTASGSVAPAWSPTTAPWSVTGALDGNASLPTCPGPHGRPRTRVRTRRRPLRPAGRPLQVLQRCPIRPPRGSNPDEDAGRRPPGQAITRIVTATATTQARWRREGFANRGGSGTVPGGSRRPPSTTPRPSPRRVPWPARAPGACSGCTGRR
jgi:hypothetical protein